ncbi:hypothetical protein AC628_14230 [Bradyrhizobium sp. NAS96.2]|nr:hypothetical protein AC628_14230 [Bradyrhizobium sp. NAS96.2]
MNRASRRTPLLLIAGRIKGIPQISFDIEPIGTVTSNTERADVSGPMQANSVKRMMALKLIGEPTPEVVGLTNVSGSVVAVPRVTAENIDARDRPVDHADSV